MYITGYDYEPKKSGRSGIYGISNVDLTIPYQPPTMERCPKLSSNAWLLPGRILANFGEDRMDTLKAPG